MLNDKRAEKLIIYERTVFIYSVYFVSAFIPFDKILSEANLCLDVHEGFRRFTLCMSRRSDMGYRCPRQNATDRFQRWPSHEIHEGLVFP